MNDIMREAFGALAALCLLHVGNGRRPRVGAIDGSVMGTSIDHPVATEQISAAQVWDVRRTLELCTVDLAAINRTDQEAAAISRHAAGMASAVGDLDQLTRHDIAYTSGYRRCVAQPALPADCPVIWGTDERGCAVGVADPPDARAA